MGLINPATNSSEAFTASERITAPLAALIISQGSSQFPDCTQVQKIKGENQRKQKREMTEARARNIISHLNPQQQRLMELAMEKGSSSWLTVLPLKEHGFHLHKGEFRDAISLRYGWSLCHTPQQCSCGTTFSVDHAMTCHMGGLPTIRHNEIRDLTVSLVTEVCHNVAIEPHCSSPFLESCSANTQPNTRQDIRTRDFWSAGQDAFLILGFFILTHQAITPQQQLQHIESMKPPKRKNNYDQWIREVEHCVFTPLVFSITGGMGREAATFYKRLAEKIASKEGKIFPHVMGWLRCHLSFAIL